MNTEKDHSYRLRQLYKVQEGSLFNYNMGIIDLAMPLDSGYLFQVLRFSSLGIWDVLKLKQTWNQKRQATVNFGCEHLFS